MHRGGLTYLVSFRSIRPSRDVAAPLGTLMMVRDLTAEYWDSFSRRMGLVLQPEAVESGGRQGVLPVVAPSSDQTMTVLKIPLVDITGVVTLQLSATLLRTLTSTDPLDRVWREGLRHQQPVAAIMGDVDLFKQFIDLYGHQGGDAWLQLVAQVLREEVSRPGDIKARHGGEESATKKVPMGW